MVTKSKTPTSPIKPEADYKRVLYRLIESIVKDYGEVSIVELNKAIDILPALFEQIKGYNEAKFKKLLADAIGKKQAIALYGLVNPAQIDILAGLFLSINTGLITSVSVDASQRIMREIAKDPKGLDPIIDRIQRAGDLTRSKARTIARTEVGKLNADMTKSKNLMMGIDSYEWRTAGDERVRDDHDICDGVIYKYGQQTDSNTGAEPAQDVNCRCVAISIITDDVLGQIL